VFLISPAIRPHLCCLLAAIELHHRRLCSASSVRTLGFLRLQASQIVMCRPMCGLSLVAEVASRGPNRRPTLSPQLEAFRHSSWDNKHMGYSNSTDFENTDEPLTTRLIKCHQSQASSSSHGPLPSSSTRFHESSQGGPPHSRAKASRPSATWSNWRSLSSTKSLPLLGSQPCLGKPMRFEPTSEPTAKRWAFEPSCGTGPAPPVSVVAPKQGMNLVHLHLHLSMDHNHPEEIISLRPNHCLTATGILQSKPRSFRASSWSTRSGLGHRDSKILTLTSSATASRCTKAFTCHYNQQATNTEGWLALWDGCSRDRLENKTSTGRRS
jgi:hypothetical protein